MENSSTTIAYFYWSLDHNGVTVFSSIVANHFKIIIMMAKNTAESISRCLLDIVSDWYANILATISLTASAYQAAQEFLNLISFLNISVSAILLDETCQSTKIKSWSSISLSDIVETFPDWCILDIISFQLSMMQTCHPMFLERHLLLGTHQISKIQKSHMQTWNKQTNKCIRE